MVKICQRIFSPQRNKFVQTPGRSNPEMIKIRANANLNNFFLIQAIVNHLKSLKFSESCNLFPLKFVHFSTEFAIWINGSDEKTFHHGTMNTDKVAQE